MYTRKNSFNISYQDLNSQPHNPNKVYKHLIDHTKYKTRKNTTKGKFNYSFLQNYNEGPVCAQESE